MLKELNLLRKNLNKLHMKKILLLVFFVVLSKVTFSQSTETKTSNDEMVIMTKDKHEALRRDMEDYKMLLAKYQTLRIEQEILIADLQRQGKSLSEQHKLMIEFRNKNELLVKEIDALQIKIDKQSLDNAELREDYSKLNRNYYTEKGKVYRMKKAQAELYIWRGSAVFFFLAMLVVGSQN